jgi:hypothetical protein
MQSRILKFYRNKTNQVVATQDTAEAERNRKITDFYDISEEAIGR